MFDKEYPFRYWQELYELKIHTLYLGFLLKKDEQYDRSINIIFAIASSGSIASWAIWENLQFIWATIIAFSSVLNAVHPFLPYKQRLKYLFSIAPNMESLCNTYEANWYKIEKGELTTEEINELKFKIKEEKAALLNRNSPDITIPNNQKLLAEAKEQAKMYFKLHYSSGEIYENQHS